MGLTEPWNEERGNAVRKSVFGGSSDSLSGLRTAASALVVITGLRTIEDATLCVCCIHEGRGTCPYGKDKQRGECPGYLLDDANPGATEDRMHSYRLSLMAALRSKP